jgi:hypothetical protein
MHTGYLHCPLHCVPRARLLQVVDAWRAAQAADALTGEPAVAPSRLEALRWVHSDSALVGGRLMAGAGAVKLGGALRLAAYVSHRPPGGSEGAAREGGGVRAAPSGGTQAAAAGPAAPL